MYGTTANNGNVQQQTIKAGPATTIQQYYRYDGANRLKLIQEGGTSAPTTDDCPNTGGAWANWCQSFAYDRFGNLWQPGNSFGTIPRLVQLGASNYDQAKNRLAGTGIHDTAGNQILFPEAQGRTARFDVENRMVEAGGVGVAAQYYYDGEGRRIKKVTGGVTSAYLYGADGELLVEQLYWADGVTPPPLPVAGTATQYLIADHLGSTRMVTDANANCDTRMDYLPFGAEIPRTLPCYGSSNARQKYAGQERDGETGRDFFQTRYYAGNQGRFVSPDGPLVDQYFESPLSWNLYAYVRNSPLSFMDTDGRGCVSPGEGKPDYTDPDVQGPSCEEIAENDKQLQPSANATAKKDVDNSEIFKAWWRGQLPRKIEYGPDDPMTQQMKDSYGVRFRIRQWVQAGCPAEASLAVGHWEAYFESVHRAVLGPWNPVQAQVGGHGGKVSIAPSGIVNYEIRNGMTASSFWGKNAFSDTTHIGKAGTWDDPKGPDGPRHNVLQVFRWSGPNPCAQ